MITTFQTWKHITNPMLHQVQITQALMARICTCFLQILVGLFIAAQANASEQLWQTNAAGDDVHIFDAETGELIERLTLGENPHGIAWAPATDTVFVSLERNSKDTGELLWVNKDTRVVEHSLSVGREPHAIAVTPNGRWVYVPCRDGHYWIVDAERKEVVAKIRTGGRPHNTTAASNELMLLSPMGDPKQVTLVNPENNHEIIGGIDFSDSVRPPAIALERALFFQHVDGLTGFEVADLNTLSKIARVTHSRNLGLPILPAKFGRIGLDGINRCHGLAVQPGEDYIWSVCGRYAFVHDLNTDQYSEVASIKLPSKAYWLTFSGSGDKVFIALADAGQVAVLKTDTFELVHLVTAGKKPKRNIVLFEEQQDD